MADTHTNLRDNSARLKRNVSKIAFRSKEKVMRTIGRSEETKDEILDHYVMLINKQQVQMQKLQKDMKDYLAALKALSVSQKAFFTSLYEIYDNDWAGKDVIASCCQRNQLLHDDIFARFQSEVTEALQEHLNEYHACKFRVEKRGRKLVDYDAARRSLQSLQTAKKPDQVKITKAKEHVQQAQQTYEELNNQLHEQLPSLYDSRLPLCVNTFSSIFESERTFSTEAAEMRSKLNNVLLNLKSSYDSGEHHIQRMQPPLDNGRVIPPASPGITNNSPPSKVRTSSTHSSSSVTKTNGETSPPPRSPGDRIHGSPSSDPSTHEYVNLQVGGMPDVVRPVSEEEETDGKQDAGGGSRKSREGNFRKPEPQSPPMHQKSNGDSAAIQPINEEPPNEEDLPSFKKIEKPELPAPRSPTKSVDSHRYLDLPPDYLYSVQALYPYRSTDDDELSFEKGDVVHIVKHPEPEEQDDGWQMGIRQKEWEEKSDLESSMGVFPENFTKRIQL